MQVAGVEMGEAQKPGPISDFQDLGVEPDHPRRPRSLEHAIEVDRGDPQSVCRMASIMVIAV